jgi:hypothetical protein
MAGALAQVPLDLGRADDQAKAVMEPMSAGAPDPRTDTLHVFTRAEVMPRPIGTPLDVCARVMPGEGPMEAACAQHTKVYVRFIVERDGTLTAPAVVKGACPTLDRLALACVAGSPRWRPGVLKGVPVRVLVVQPIQIEPR